MSFSLVITNYNTWELTEKAIASVLKYHLKDCNEIIVIDDASAEKADLPLKFPQVQVIRNEQNLGYVRSINKAFQHVTQELVLVLDSDAHLLTSISKALEDMQVHPGLGNTGFCLYDRNDVLTGSYEPEPGPLNLIVGQKIDNKIKKMFWKEDDPIVVYSCAMLTRKKAFESVKGFDESFDFLDADVDYSMKLRRKGWEIRLDTTARIFHEGGGSPQTSEKRVLRFYRNRLKLLRKHSVYGTLKIFFIKLVIFFRSLAEIFLLLLTWLFSPRTSYLKMRTRAKLIANLPAY